MNEKLEQYKLDKDLKEHIDEIAEGYKDWDKQQFEDRIIVLDSMVEEREQTLAEVIATRAMFKANPLLAEAPFEFMKTMEYANLKMAKHLDEFDQKIADNKRIIKLQNVELEFCKDQV